ncbi:MAG: hypothetical protein GY803_05230, partial [Chloroflexi bacterium]|nr:hypothetical protein [Chloroflexota bacterium]
MTISGPRLRTLLRQAERTAAAGKRAAAETLYRQIIEEAPETEAAWLGLAGVVNGKEEKTAVYNRILQINPENTTAQTKLAQLQSGVAESFERPRNWLDSVTESPEVEEATNATANTGRVEETAVPIPEHASDDAVGDNFDLA